MIAIMHKDTIRVRNNNLYALVEYQTFSLVEILILIKKGE
jgi:hypothetical protein